jgi:hypothetical protein
MDVDGINCTSLNPGLTQGVDCILIEYFILHTCDIY